MSNSGPLIHLARAGRLEVLRRVFGEVGIPREVKVEVVDIGKEKGHSDALLVESAMDEGWIKPMDVEVPEGFASLTRIAGLRRAEMKVIHYAFEENATALLDDESARVFARSLGVRIKGSLGIIIEAFERAVMTKDESLEAIDNLSDVMYLSADVYRLARRRIEY